jgi:GxxExxY protein
MNSLAAKKARTAHEISGIVLTAAMKIHTSLGPGLLESVYEACLAFELRAQGLMVETQVALPVLYEAIKLEAGDRIDLVVEDSVLVEIKSVETLAPVHHAQTLTYLKLSGKSLALLINFNTAHLKDGIKWYVNGTEWKRYLVVTSCPSCEL